MALHQFDQPDLNDVRNHEALLDDFLTFYRTIEVNIHMTMNMSEMTGQWNPTTMHK
jgi:hypothetical protein